MSRDRPNSCENALSLACHSSSSPSPETNAQPKARLTSRQIQLRLRLMFIFAFLSAISVMSTPLAYALRLSVYSNHLGKAPTARSLLPVSAAASSMEWSGIKANNIDDDIDSYKQRLRQKLEFNNAEGFDPSRQPQHPIDDLEHLTALHRWPASGSAEKNGGSKAKWRSRKAHFQESLLDSKDATTLQGNAGPQIQGRSMTPESLTQQFSSRTGGQYDTNSRARRESGAAIEDDHDTLINSLYTDCGTRSGLSTAASGDCIVGSSPSHEGNEVRQRQHLFEGRMPRRPVSKSETTLWEADHTLKDNARHLDEETPSNFAILQGRSSGFQPTVRPDRGIVQRRRAAAMISQEDLSFIDHEMLDRNVQEKLPSQAEADTTATSTTATDDSEFVAGDPDSSCPKVRDASWPQDVQCRWFSECEEIDSHVPYTILAYCYIKSTPGSVVLYLFWAALLFYLGGLVADYYLSPPILELATTLKISDAVAGCTILAVGNACGDLMGGVWAALSDAQSIDLFVGDIIGASLFTSNVVVGSVLLASKVSSVGLTRSVFLRDGIFLLFCLLSIIVLHLLSPVHVATPVFFFLIYAAYIYFVVHTERKSTRLLAILSKKGASEDDACSPDSLPNGEGKGDDGMALVHEGDGDSTLASGEQDGGGLKRGKGNDNALGQTGTKGEDKEKGSSRRDNNKKSNKKSELESEKVGRGSKAGHPNADLSLKADSPLKPLLIPCGNYDNHIKIVGDNDRELQTAQLQESRPHSESRSSAGRSVRVSFDETLYKTDGHRLSASAAGPGNDRAGGDHHLERNRATSDTPGSADASFLQLQPAAMGPPPETAAATEEAVMEDHYVDPRILIRESARSIAHDKLPNPYHYLPSAQPPSIYAGADDFHHDGPDGVGLSDSRTSNSRDATTTRICISPSPEQSTPPLPLSLFSSRRPSRVPFTIGSRIIHGRSTPPKRYLKSTTIDRSDGDLTHGDIEAAQPPVVLTSNATVNVYIKPCPIHLLPSPLLLPTSHPLQVSSRRGSGSAALHLRAGKRLLSRIEDEQRSDLAREQLLEALRMYPGETLDTVRSLSLRSLLPEPDTPYVRNLTTELKKRKTTWLERFNAPFLLIWTFTIPSVNVKDWGPIVFPISIPTLILANNWRSVTPVICLVMMSTGMALSLGLGASLYCSRRSKKQKLSEKGILQLQDDTASTQPTNSSVVPFFDRKPSPWPIFNQRGKLRWLYLIVAMSMSLYWNALVIAEVMQCVKAVGALIHLGDEALGLTVLAWGNSMADLFANVAVSRSGHPEMGLGGAYGAPIVLMSFGAALVALISIVRQLALKLPLRAYPSALDPPTLVCVSCQAGVLATWIAFVSFKEFRLRRIYGASLLGAFFLIVGATVLTMYLRPHH